MGDPQDREADRAEDEADRAQGEADRAEVAAQDAEAAADAARTSAASSVEQARLIDNALDLVVDDDGPASAQPATTPGRPTSLIRHSPFYIGFVGALGALTAFFLGRQVLSISSALTLIVMALFLAIGLNPAVEFFMKRGLKRGFAVAIVLLSVMIGLTFFVFTIAPVISEQIQLISSNAPGWLTDLQRNHWVRDLDERFDAIDRVQDYIANGDFGERVFGGVLGFGLAVLSLLTNSLIVLVLMVYFISTLPSIKHAAYSLAPASRRPRVRELGDRIIKATGAYVAGAFVVAVCAGVSTLVFTFVIGLGEYSFALAFVVGLLSLIPVVGSVISAVVITLLGLTVSPTVALVCLVYYLAYQQVEAYLIYPRIMARSVEVPGAVTVVAALLGGSLMGIIGALLAVPVAAALLLLHREVFLRRQDAR